jgi:hypothetical protein
MTQTQTPKINLATAVFCTIFGDALEVVAGFDHTRVVGYDTFSTEEWEMITAEAEWSDKYQAWVINW